MEKQSSYNYTIVGAGGSGLWLANALLEQGLLEVNTLCIVESDAHKANDRTWCYWATQPIAPAEMVSKEWQSIFQLNISSHAKSLTPYSYYHVRSADFYSQIKTRLSKCPAIYWHDEEVIEVSDLTTQVEVRTATQTWQSDRIFLSALPPSSSNQADYKLAQERNFKKPLSIKSDLFLWQSFVGWRVETAQNVFDESSMSMMDFSIAQGNYTQFMYELPFSSSEALVEMTRFGEKKLSIPEAEEELRNYMDRKGCSYKISEVEIGAIPMTPQFDAHRKQVAKDDRIIYIGTLGGAIKPTTGFGFKRMHAYSEELAKALKENRTLPTMYRPYRFRLYDELLLRILQNQPGQGKEVFEQLFRSQPIQRILRFLDEETTIGEEITIFSRLPIKLFLKSLFDHMLAR
ncbi:MAG: lycopene cyclase family protein [Cyclobacteriaceae bacterium]|nr:lycopene cyclase family protein [Cyclobacteriaceae bacterium]